MRTNIGMAAAVLASGLVAQAYGAAVSAPYTVAFNSAADVADFTARAGKNDGTGNVDTWSVSGGTWNHSLASVYADSNGSGQILETSGVSGQDFAVSMDVTIVGRNFNGGSGWNINMPFLSSNATQTYWSWDTFYNVSIHLGNGADSFGITSSDVDGNYNPMSLANASLTSPLTVGGTYNMSITGTYSSGALTLNAVLKEGTTELASLEATQATPKAGNYFGISESAGWGSSGQASYDNFTITNAVPEPMSLGFVLLGGMGLMARRRKSA